MKYERLGKSVLAAAIASVLTGCASMQDTALSKAAATDAVAATSATKNEASSRGRVLATAREIAELSAPSGDFELPPPPRRGAIVKRFDLKAENAPAAGVYQGIVEGSGMTAAVSPLIASQRVSVSIKDASLTDALETMRDLYGHEFRIEGRRVFIGQPELSTAVFRIDYLVGARTGQSDLRVTSGSVSDNPTGSSSSSTSTTSQADSSSGQNRSMNMSRVSTRETNDLWANMEKTIAALVQGEGRTIVVDPASGTIFVRGMPKELREVEKYVKAVDKSVGRQVMLEAKIIQVTLSDSSQSGVNWAAFDRNGGHRWSMNASTSAFQLPGGQPTGASGSTGASLGSVLGAFPFSGGLGLAFQSSSFAALISFLQTQGSVHVLSSPRIATLNNQKAVLKVGNDEFFVTNVSSTTTTGTGGGTASTPNVTVAPFFSGVALDVTPQISEKGDVTLRIHPQVSKVEEKAKTVSLGVAGSITMPLASSSVSETDSVVRLQNGNIVAIGGLMTSEGSSSRSKVPFAGDVPLAGEAFKHSAGSGKKTELIILIRPTVIESASDWDAGIEGFTGGAR